MVGEDDFAFVVLLQEVLDRVGEVSGLVYDGEFALRGGFGYGLFAGDVWGGDTAGDFIAGVLCEMRA